MTRKAQQYTQEAVEKRVARDTAHKAMTKTPNAHVAAMLTLMRHYRYFTADMPLNADRRRARQMWACSLSLLRKALFAVNWRFIP